MNPLAFSAGLAAALMLQATVAAAQTSAPYIPKFARAQQDSEMISFETCIKPEWPKSSLRNEEQGTVRLRFVVAANGRLLRHEVVRSSGFPALDKAAADGLSTCKFRPASINGKPVQSIASMQYVWTLE